MSSPKKHHVVVLDDWYVPLPMTSFEYTIDQYSQSTVAQIAERIKDATIVMTSPTPVTRAAIETAPNLQLVACFGAGTDKVDMDAVRERGITVCRVPGQNSDSVAEHGFALYYAIRRHVVQMNQFTMDESTWGKNQLKFFGKPPRTNAEENLVVIGYGSIGRLRTLECWRFNTKIA